MPADLVVLRGHHLLCIQGFRGHGYSEQFVAAMWAVVDRLTEAPETIVELAEARDLICLSCPHLFKGVCKKRGEESEAEAATHDRRVLGRLGLRVSQRIAWSKVLDIIRTAVKPEDLPELCLECQWAPLGFCGEGLRSLLNDASR